MKLLNKLAAFAGLATLTTAQQITGEFNTPVKKSFYKQPLTKKQQKARDKNKRAAKVRHKL